MKEVTHEEWLKNPTPRLMWVWNSSFKNKGKAKVIYVAENFEYPVMTIIDNDYCIFRHCAEIEEPKTRRMTKQELAWWLRGRFTREYKFSHKILVHSEYIYSEQDADILVGNDILVRENGGEWHEPLVEVEE